MADPSTRRTYRILRFATAACAVAAASGASVLTSIAPAFAAPAPVAATPSPAATSGTCAGLHAILSPSCIVGGVAADTANLTINAVFNAMSSWVSQGAIWLLHAVGSALFTTTRPALGSTWFTHHFTTMAGIAALVVLPLLLVACAQAVLRQDAGALLRPALVHVPLALVFTGVAIEVVQLALGAVDQLSAVVSRHAGLDAGTFLSSAIRFLGGNAPGANPGAPAFVVFLAALAIATGAFALWLELVVRTAAIYVCVLFLPLGLASVAWPSIAHWCRRLAETLAALILAKFVMVAIMSLAAGALGGGTGSAGFAAIVAGLALLLLAVACPFVLLRLIPLVEAGAGAHLEGASRRMLDAGPRRLAGVLAMGPEMFAASSATGALGIVGAGGGFADAGGTAATEGTAGSLGPAGTWAAAGGGQGADGRAGRGAPGWREATDQSGGADDTVGLAEAPGSQEVDLAPYIAVDPFYRPGTSRAPGSTPPPASDAGEGGPA